MCTVDEIICLLVLLGLSWSDMRKRQVSVGVLMAAGITAVLYLTINGESDIGGIVMGAVPGMIFLLISKVTEEGVGYGDSLGILILGSYLGFWKILTVLLIAFFLMFCALIPILWKKKMSRKASLAFYPFLTGGYLWNLLMGG